MAERADRIVELWRLYCSLPDQTEHVTTGESKGGGISLVGIIGSIVVYTADMAANHKV